MSDNTGVILALAILAIAYLGTGVISAIVRIKTQPNHDHAACIELIRQRVGAEHEAEVLDRAARDYDSPEGRIRVAELNRATDWSASTESLTAIWLRDQASTIRNRNEEVAS